MPMVRAKIANLRRRLETLEANRKPIPIRPVLSPVRQMEGFAIYLLEGFEHRAVVLVEQSVRDMQSIVGIDPDQMGIEGGMMDFGERHAVRDDGLPELLVLIGNDVCRPYVLKEKDGAVIEANARLSRTFATMYLDWRGEWRLPPLNGIASAPLLREDGTIQSTEGYDVASAMWRENVPDLSGYVPDQPTADDAASGPVIA